MCMPARPCLHFLSGRKPFPRTALVAVEAVEEVVEQRVERLMVLELDIGIGELVPHESTYWWKFALT